MARNIVQNCSTGNRHTGTGTCAINPTGTYSTACARVRLNHLLPLQEDVARSGRADSGSIIGRALIYNHSLQSRASNFPLPPGRAETRGTRVATPDAGTTRAIEVLSNRLSRIRQGSNRCLQLLLCTSFSSATMMGLPKPSSTKQKTVSWGRNKWISTALGERS